MKKDLIYLLVMSMTLAFSCGQGGNMKGDYIVKKITDREKLNIRDSVEEFREFKRGSSLHVDYTVFNKKGYVVEKGKIVDDKKDVAEIFEYDADDNLVRQRVIIKSDSYLNNIDPGYVDYFHDQMGRVTLRVKLVHNYKNEKLVDSTRLRYVIDGRREMIYINERLTETVEYDKYRNLLTRMTYRWDETEQNFEEWAYEYSDKGVLLKKIRYATVGYPVSDTYRKELRKQTIEEYTYDENNYLIKIHRFDRYIPNEEKNGVTHMDRAAEDVIYTYDEFGNDTFKRLYTFEYDRSNNWIVRYYKGKMDAERYYKYFGSEDFDNPYDSDHDVGGEEEYDEEG